MAKLAKNHSFLAKLAMFVAILADGSAGFAAIGCWDVGRQHCHMLLQTQCIFTTIPQGGFAQTQRKIRKTDRSIMVLIWKILQILPKGHNQNPFRDNPAAVAGRKMAAAMAALIWAVDEILLLQLRICRFCLIRNDHTPKLNQNPLLNPLSTFTGSLR